MSKPSIRVADCISVGDWVVFETALGFCHGPVTEVRAKSILVSGSYYRTVTLGKVRKVGDEKLIKATLGFIKQIEADRRYAKQRVEDEYQRALGKIFGQAGSKV